MAALVAYRPLERETARVVAEDGLPRVARYVEVFDDDTTGAEVEHVLYMDPAAPLPQSMAATDWLATRGPLPAGPTPQQITQALAARDAERAKIEQTKAGIRVALAPMKGKKPAQWTLPEIRDLLAVLLDQAGFLDSDGGVR